jgi:hypothetical protein
VFETIFKNGKRALPMAKKAHEIFNEQFSIENHLFNLEILHQQEMLEWPK